MQFSRGNILKKKSISYNYNDDDLHSIQYILLLILKLPNH